MDLVKDIHTYIIDTILGVLKLLCIHKRSTSEPVTCKSSFDNCFSQVWLVKCHSCSVSIFLMVGSVRIFEAVFGESHHTLQVGDLALLSPATELVNCVEDVCWN